MNLLSQMLYVTCVLASRVSERFNGGRLPSKVLLPLTSSIC